MYIYIYAKSLMFIEKFLVNAGCLFRLFYKRERNNLVAIRYITW